ncbi:cold-shock protein [Serinicoccus marinus]|uniref:cold-shock protein n=1 Tax=Serinicoccus marinus TaxID=247333 RepID=UPI0023AF980F|nr:cold shock domain-containing protein [Serinicoccus marinus]
MHASEIVSNDTTRVLREGQVVEFEIGEGDRGPQARRVRVTAEQPTDAPLGLLGTVYWYEPSKGYGFVSPDDGGDEIFLHSSAIVPGGLVSEGQGVAFLVVDSERARRLATCGSSVGRHVGAHPRGRRPAPAPGRGGRPTARPEGARVWSRATTRTGASASSSRTPEARTSSCTSPSCATARR